MLYTLSELSCIDIYDLGTAGTALTRVKRFKNVVESVRSVCAQGTMDVGRIVSLKVVSPQESQIVHLIAVTSTGMRLYFTTTPSISQRPKGLDLIHVRPLPQGVDSGRQVVASFYEDGAFLVALGVEQTEDEDTLLGCTLDVANLLANRAALR
jgi:nuclear pore complex protein Nup155